MRSPLRKQVGYVVSAGMFTSLFACTLGGFGPPPPPMTRLDLFEPIVCAPLNESRSDSVPPEVEVTVGPDSEESEIEIYYPAEDDAMAELTVPRAALTAPTTFTLSADPSTPYVTVNVTITGVYADSTFSPALQLVMFPRESRDCRFPEETPGFGVFLYNMGDSLFISGGEFDPSARPVARGGELEDPFGKEPRARANLDHFSGFVLAQGRR